MNNIEYSTKSDAKLIGQRLHCFDSWNVRFSNMLRLLFCDLVSPMRFATWWSWNARDRIGYMLPRPATNYLDYLTNTNSKYFGKSFTGFSIGVPNSDFLGLPFRNFARSVLLSLGRIVSSFRHAVFMIVRVCSNKYMIGIAAHRIVAMMTGKKSFRDCSIKALPSKSMGCDFSSLDSECSVPPSRQTGNPRPTFVWSSLFDFGPKSLFNEFLSGVSFRPCFSCPSSGSTTKLIQGNIVLHKSVRLICAMLRAVVAAPGHIYLSTFPQVSQPV